MFSSLALSEPTGGLSKPIPCSYVFKALRLSHVQSSIEIDRRPSGRIHCGRSRARRIHIAHRHQLSMRRHLPSSEQQNPLKTLTLEQLGNIEVTTVSKEPEEVWNTPAAIYVITQEDIQRSGATEHSRGVAAGARS